MNASDIMMYGHRTMLKELGRVPVDKVDEGGVCGWWTTKDVVAHLTSHEHVLVDVLNTLLGGGETPYLNAYRAGNFNDDEVEKRKGMSFDEVLAEYNAAHDEAMLVIEKVPVSTRQQVGAIPWYGAEYALDDYIVYGIYGHKREHSAQFAVYADSLGH